MAQEVRSATTAIAEGRRSLSTVGRRHCFLLARAGGVERLFVSGAEHELCDLIYAKDTNSLGIAAVIHAAGIAIAAHNTSGHYFFLYHGAERYFSGIMLLLAIFCLNRQLSILRFS